MKSKMFLLLLAMCVLATPMFAQGTNAGAVSTPLITAGIAMAVASGLCGLAQGKAVASSAEAIARNPGAAGAIRGALIIGLALIESLALYTLIIVLLKG